MGSAEVGHTVATLAGNQDGVVSTAQLRGCSVTRRQIDRWVQNGRLVRIHQGVYAVGHRPTVARAEWRAALLAIGGTAAIGYSTSLALRDLPEPRELDGQLHVVTQRGGPRKPAGVHLHRVSVLDDRDIEVVDGLRCTSVALTLVHLASVLSEPGLRFVCERVEYARQLDVNEIALTLTRMRRPRGIRLLRRVLADTSLETALLDSTLERRLLKLAVEAGLAPTGVQQWFTLEGYGRARADLWYEHARLVVEADGPHHKLPLQRARDNRRDAAMAAAGIRVLRIDDTTIDLNPGLAVRRLRDRLNAGCDFHQGGG